MLLGPFVLFFSLSSIESVQAIKSDPDFVRNVQQIIILGNAFSVNGNVNPAAEENVKIFPIRLLFLRS